MSTVPENVLADEMQQLNYMYQLDSVLERMIRNLLLLRTGNNAKTIIVFTADLYRLAMEYYGDATKWTAIARANNLVDPYFSSSTATTLIIPETATDTGGILTS